jgi:hypothetical protein
MLVRTQVGRWAFLAAALLSPPAFAQPAPQGVQQGAPPDRIGPVWDHREHEPNPAEVQARERALGLPPASQRGETQEVETLYRDLTGSNPNPPPPTTRGAPAQR